MILALFARLRVTEAESFDHIHGLVEATKRALRARDRVLTDPGRLPHPLDRYLEPRFLAGEAMKIDRRKAARWPLAPASGDTVWMGAADTSGLVVSYIQSLYWEFGSGCVLPRTGVMMQNRGMSFSLTPRRAQSAGARAGCRSTPLIRRWRCSRTDASWPTAPWAATGNRKPRPRVFTRHVDFRRAARRGDRPAALGLGPNLGRRAPRLRLESRFDGDLIDPLAVAGHDVDVLPEPYSDTWGTPARWCCIRTARCEGVHDPRADGGAAGV